MITKFLINQTKLQVVLPIEILLNANHLATDATADRLCLAHNIVQRNALDCLLQFGIWGLPCEALHQRVHSLGQLVRATFGQRKFL